MWPLISRGIGTRERNTQAHTLPIWVVPALARIPSHTFSPCRPSHAEGKPVPAEASIDCLQSIVDNLPELPGNGTHRSLFNWGPLETVIQPRMEVPPLDRATAGRQGLLSHFSLHAGHVQSQSAESYFQVYLEAQALM